MEHILSQKIGPKEKNVLPSGNKNKIEKERKK